MGLVLLTCKFVFEVPLDMGLWDNIGLVKGLLFVDTRPLLEPMSTLCGQFTNMLGICLFITAATKLRGGILDSPCSSVRPSVCLSVRPSVRGSVSG